MNPRRIKVGLELTSKCNLRCGMCPLPVLRRPYEDMAWPLVERAAKEIHGNGFRLKWLHETVDDFRKLFDLKRYRNARVIEKTCEALDVNEETDLHGKFYGCVQGAFFTWVVIFADGRVTHCCYDAHGEQILGDLKTQSLQEILNGERMKEMQSAFERRDFTNLPRCAECFKHGGESNAFNDVLTRVQNLPGAAKDVVRKVIDVRYRT